MAKQMAQIIDSLMVVMIMVNKADTREWMKVHANYLLAASFIKNMHVK
jgi:hypothetical protein